MSGKVGASFERLTADLFEADGYVVFRSAGSLGAADLAALRAGSDPLLIQVKYARKTPWSAFAPAERRALLRDAAKAGARAIYCYWAFGTSRLQIFPSEEWPEPRDYAAADFIVDPLTDCWVWAKAKQADGYGIVNRDGCVQLAHRFYYESSVGPIPPGLQIDHLCRVRACVNPAHLEPVTQSENRLRGSLTKLTARQIREIRSSPLSSSELAEQHGVGRSYIWRIKKGYTRLDVPLDPPEEIAA